MPRPYNYQVHSTHIPSQGRLIIAFSRHNELTKSEFVAQCVKDFFDKLTPAELKKYERIFEDLRNSGELSEAERDKLAVPRGVAKNIFLEKRKANNC